MKQAKTLTAPELKRVLAVVAANRHAPRYKLAVLDISPRFEPILGRP
jgi:hypothetical protein